MEDYGTHVNPHAQKENADDRWENVGWALFLMMSGGVLLVPHIPAPWGVWLIGTGLILLGLNGARYVGHMRVNGFTLALGLLALVAGVGEFLAVDVPVLALGLVLIGGIGLVKTLKRKTV